MPRKNLLLYRFEILDEFDSSERFETIGMPLALLIPFPVINDATDDPMLLEDRSHDEVSPNSERPTRSRNVMQIEIRDRRRYRLSRTISHGIMK
jgi:hypothetical protein